MPVSDLYGLLLLVADLRSILHRLVLGASFDASQIRVRLMVLVLCVSLTVIATFAQPRPRFEFIRQPGLHSLLKTPTFRVKKLYGRLFLLNSSCQITDHTSFDVLQSFQLIFVLVF